jgi:DNA mismatch endonuclease, patch repair protein
MPDKFDKKTRSSIMSRIRSEDTALEVNFRKALWAGGLHYRTHYKTSVGKPDIVFPSKKVVIFVDGDFWHGYNWKKLGKVPPKGFWQEKIERNIRRDEMQTRQLRKEGWIVLRFWEHDIEKHLDRCINKVKRALESQ